MPKPDKELDRALNDATQASQEPASVPGAQQKVDNLEDRIPGSNYLSTGKDFYNNNTNSISSSTQKVAAAVDVKALEENVRGFAESSRVLMKVLDEVAKIHPFVGVPVLAFKAVVTLELKRKENDKKVIMLQLRMREMMSALAELRNIKRPDHQGTDGVRLQDRMRELMIQVANDITSCGNHCDNYSKKHFLVKLLKGPVYESGLAEFATTFADRQNDIQRALILHTAISMDSAMSTLASINTAVKLLALFQTLETPKEKELKKYIGENGGVERFITDDRALGDLENMRQALDPTLLRDGAIGNLPTPYTHLGSSYPTQVPSTYIQPVRSSSHRGPPIAHYYSHSHPSQMQEPRESNARSHYPGHYADLDRPYSPPIIMPVASSYPRQPTHHSSHSHRPQVQVRRESYAGSPYQDWYTNPDHDYGLMPGVPPTGDLMVLNVLNVEPIRNELNEDVADSLSQNMIVFQRKLDIQKVQLLEEIGDVVKREGDRIVSTVVSGPHDLIVDPDLHRVWKYMGWKGSVKARRFVLALQDYFIEKYHASETLPDSVTPDLKRALSQANKRADDHWALASINVHNMQPILEAFDDDGTGFVSIKEANQLAESRPHGWSLPQWIAFWAVGWHYTIWDYKHKICGILSSMYAPVSLDSILPSNRLLVDLYLDHPIIRKLDLLLCSVRPFTGNLDVNLRHKILPYLECEEARMQRNLESVAFEIDTPATLTLIAGPGRIESYLFPFLFLLLRQHLRIIKVASKYVLHPNELSSATQSIAHVFDAVTDRIDTISAIFAQEDGRVLYDRLERFAFSMFNFLSNPAGYGDTTHDLHSSYSDDLNIDDIPLTNMKFGVQKETNGVPYDLLNLEANTSEPHPRLNGEWSGYCFNSDQTGTEGLMQIFITVVDDAFHGRGHDIHGTFSIHGHTETDHINLQMTFTREGNDLGGRNVPTSCKAMLHALRERITGKWGIGGVQEKGNIWLCRTPASLHRFRHLNEKCGLDLAHSRWSFATQAVLSLVRQRLWSWRFFKDRFIERRRFIELYCRGYLSNRPGALNRREFVELKTLELFLHPADAQFYRSIARFQFKPCIHINAICEFCKCMITGDRVICIECDFDLCRRCSLENAAEYYRNHGAWHPLLKVSRVLHTGYRRLTVQYAYERIGIPVAPSIAPSADSHSILSDESRSMAESRVNPVKSQRFTEMDISTIELQPTNILLPRPRLVADEPFARQLPRPYSWAMYHLRGGDDHVTSVPEAMAAPLQPRHPVPIPLCCCCGSSSPPYWRCISCDSLVLICADCDTQKRPCLDIDSKHNYMHLLVRPLGGPPNPGFVTSALSLHPMHKANRFARLWKLRPSTITPAVRFEVPQSMERKSRLSNILQAFKLRQGSKIEQHDNLYSPIPSNFPTTETNDDN